jgi:hypothetical protein
MGVLTVRSHKVFTIFTVLKLPSWRLKAFVLCFRFWILISFSSEYYEVPFDI